MHTTTNTRRTAWLTLLTGLMIAGCAADASDGADPAEATAIDPGGLIDSAEVGDTGEAIGAVDTPAADDAKTAPGRRKSTMRLAPPDGIPAREQGAAAAAADNIDYHNGAVFTGPAHVYYIYYGNWHFSSASNATHTILEDFARNVGGSSYYHINSTYPVRFSDGTLVYVPNAVSFGGRALRYNATNPIVLSDDDVRNIVFDTINRGLLPLDTSGVYFVLGAGNVTNPGLCTEFCGWHTWDVLGGNRIIYSFVGDGARCPSTCIASENQTRSPNANHIADGMASVIAHELSESVTDPYLDAWYFNGRPSEPWENADECAWQFGGEYTTANGAFANVRLGARDYLLQMNWVRSQPQRCTISF